MVGFEQIDGSATPTPVKVAKGRASKAADKADTEASDSEKVTAKASKSAKTPSATPSKEKVTAAKSTKSTGC